MRNSGPRRLALPMYDLPELEWATGALAASLLAGLSNAGLGGLPQAREQPDDLPALWRDPSLLLAQTCGYPLATTLRGQVRLVATPCYTAPGCDGPQMCSAIVVRADDPARDLAGLRGRAVCALNGHDSNSGMNLLRAAVAPLAGGERFFRDIVVTGSHAASLGAVQAGQADIAAIDCVTLELLRRVRPAALAGLRVLDWTPSSPGLPLVMARGRDAADRAALRAALDGLLLDPALAGARDALLIERFAFLDEEEYAIIAEMEREAGALGYPVLR
ncbi:phosphate/phosphite/phosphonate ABC transporter substrate-binding protein [Lichenicoccus sp.]|uniref:phosphate/phosphite/phosphonate ABC transporter substrate-binding protein n=1 Tax=Lichenicoccus sp. TaxID=2781899 RepID=UPI003D109B8B